MYQLVIELNYGCYPVWVYHEGKPVINDLPLELSEEQEIDEAFEEIRSIYDSLFQNGTEGLRYEGFHNKEDKRRFLDMIDGAANLIRMKMGSALKIEKKYNAKSL
jgi:hypothetical protein